MTMSKKTGRHGSLLCVAMDSKAEQKLQKINSFSSTKLQTCNALQSNQWSLDRGRQRVPRPGLPVFCFFAITPGTTCALETVAEIDSVGLMSHAV